MVDQKKLLEELQDIKAIDDLDRQVNKLWAFALECSAEPSISDVYQTFSQSIETKESVCGHLVYEADRCNLGSVGNLIAGIKDFNAQYFWIDGYGNYSNISDDHMETLMYDIETTIKEATL